VLSLIMSAVFASQISPVIYLNRCAGGCTVIGNTTNDARTHESTIPLMPGTYTLDEFTNAAGQAGAAADAEWAGLVQCLRELYSPFAVRITDVAPATTFTEVMIGGTARELGEPTGVLAIAPLTADCSPRDDVIAFVLAGDFPAHDRVANLCWSAAQETGHVFGLEDTDAADDVMSYQLSCGGQEFFRNVTGTCGYGCRCGPTQDSYQTLLALFGPGVSTIPPPTASIAFPNAGDTVGENAAVQVNAGSPRGVTNIELWLNGYRWASQAGAPCGGQGQPDPSPYTFTIPSEVPDSIIDVVVKAYDDVGAEGDATVTITKGAPCATADTCATGQVCDQGRCFWNAPAGELGAACTYDQFCISNECVASSDGSRCTQSCVLGVADACPSGFECIEPGACWPKTTSSGCQAGGTGAIPTWVGLVFIVRRRRRTS
jgi:hypothetical protein